MTFYIRGKHLYEELCEVRRASKEVLFRMRMMKVPMKMWRMLRMMRMVLGKAKVP